jgi:membrane protein DedA with SNARE-associated domain
LTLLFFNSLLDFVSGSPWTYAAVLGIAAGDAVLPILPSETAVITAGVVASSGDLILPLVIACAAAGALIGDNATYLIGSRIGRHGAERILRGERGRRSLDWAERTLADRGGMLIVVARFIPGGRTATTLTAGIVGFPWKRRFLPITVVAALFWACYAALLGYFGGRAFEDQPWKGLLIAFALAGGLAVAVEGIRHLRNRRRTREA